MDPCVNYSLDLPINRELIDDEVLVIELPLPQIIPASHPVTVSIFSEPYTPEDAILGFAIEEIYGPDDELPMFHLVAEHDMNGISNPHFVFTSTYASHKWRITFHNPNHVPYFVNSIVVRSWHPGQEPPAPVSPPIPPMPPVALVQFPCPSCGRIFSIN